MAKTYLEEKELVKTMRELSGVLAQKRCKVDINFVNLSTSLFKNLCDDIGDHMISWFLAAINTGEKNLEVYYSMDNFEDIDDVSVIERSITVCRMLETSLLTSM